MKGHQKIVFVLLFLSCIARADIQTVIDLEIQEKYDKAFLLAKKMAASNNPQGMYILAGYYDQGLVVEQSLEAGLSWTKKAAALEYRPAITHLAFRYYHGLGVKKDSNKAVMIFQQAGDLGDGEAWSALIQIYLVDKKLFDNRKAYDISVQLIKEMNAIGAATLGYIYLKGLEPDAADDSDLNIDKALAWSKIGAKAGDKSGQSNLAYIYSQEVYERYNPQLAYYWASLANRDKSGATADLIEEMAFELSSKDKRKIDKKINSWYPLPMDKLELPSQY